MAIVLAAASGGSAVACSLLVPNDAAGGGAPDAIDAGSDAIADGAAPSPTVACTNAECDVTTSMCCLTSYTTNPSGGERLVDWTCSPRAPQCQVHDAGPEGSVYFVADVTCDDSKDCAPGTVCCWDLSCGSTNVVPKRTSCVLPGACPPCPLLANEARPFPRISCRTDVPNSCPDGGTCMPFITKDHGICH